MNVQVFVSTPGDGSNSRRGATVSASSVQRVDTNSPKIEQDCHTFLELVHGFGQKCVDPPQRTVFAGPWATMPRLAGKKARIVPWVYQTWMPSPRTVRRISASQWFHCIQRPMCRNFISFQLNVIDGNKTGFSFQKVENVCHYAIKNVVIIHHVTTKDVISKSSAPACVLSARFASLRLSRSQSFQWSHWDVQSQ